MAYNKSKFVEAAQKLLNQGKVPQAIAEYQQILKYEPRDQVTLMTIGELYIRQGETIQAIDYFERLAQLFVTDGFLTKAIAVYKRIAKLAPEEIRPLEKLADLYVQQGVMSEARPLFLQLAELHLKNNKQPEAVALLKKLLAAEPDNLRIQIRLADLCQAMGQSGEALQGYVSAAQRALARGEQAECEKLADKALQIDPKNLDALIVKARAFSTAGNIKQATQILEKVPDLDKGGEPAELLLDLYLKNDKWDEATTLAMNIFTADLKNFGATQKVTEGLLEAGQTDRAMKMVSQIRLPMLDAGEHEPLERLLTELAARMPGRLEPLEWLVDTFGRTSDSFRLPDALANLGDALVAAGKLQRAKDVFQQLVDREPDSDAAKRKLSDVERRLGGGAPEEPTPAADVVVEADELRAEPPKAPTPKLRAEAEPLEPPQPTFGEQPAAPAGKGEPELDEETQKFIAQSLTDVDLFASYGLTQKAIGLLEAILRRAPTHTPTLEKLLDFVLGAGDDRRTAELAAQLEHIHAGRGDTRSSERFAELRRRFQRAAGMSDEDIAAAVAAALPQTVDTVPVEEAAPAGATEAIPEIEVAPVQAAPVEEEVPEIEVAEEPSEAVKAKAKPAEAPKVEESEAESDWASVLEETREPEVKAGKKEAKAPAPAAPPAPPHHEEEISMDELMVQEEAPVAADESMHEELVPASEDTGHSEFVVPAEETDPESWAAPEEKIPTETPAPAARTGAPHEDVPAHPETLLPDEELTALPVPEHAEIASEKQEPALEEPEQPVHGKTAPEPEFELERDFELVLEPEEVVPPHEMMNQVPTGKDAKAPAKAEKPGAAFSSEDFLSDLAKELDGLGIEELAAPKSQAKKPAEAKAAPPPPVSEPVKAQEKPLEHEPLKEVFDEFRAELGEMGAEDEDLETHYNLGIAFREMGLLEEAIGEFQKVAKANDRGKAFRYAMQCSTLLGLAFMEKGQPDIAAIWYERALHTPDIDSESKLALRYDLGVAQESAGDLDAALKSFSQVYAVNIDYRDVAERIASLQKPAR
jgi:tetratricopeptide (TPR) repeat protein